MMNKNQYKQKISIDDRTFSYYNIKQLQITESFQIDRLPFSIRILVENLLRKLDGEVVTEADLKNITGRQKTYDMPVEIPYHPARVLMQDFTGVPAVVDLAAMRDAMAALGGDPKRINPMVPVDLVVDHSVQVDRYGTIECQKFNVAREYERNDERYKLLKWAQKSFDNFNVVPPRSGICHQVNLEYLAKVIIPAEENGETVVFPDTLVGLDSHTTMINGIGVMGWGVGGIEAEAVMLGRPYYMSIPEVIGFRMTGALNPGVTATDLVLKVVRMLREFNVVEKFVEFFGPGMKRLSVPDRATIANMSPEYGATMGFFPIDEKTIEYLKMTHRADQAEIVDTIAKQMGLFYTGETDPEYTAVLHLDLSTVVPAVSGPSRPREHIELTNIKSAFSKMIPDRKPPADIIPHGQKVSIGDGGIVVAAITSCTNTSNPGVMIGAGLLAKNAVQKGLRVPVTVKTSLAPGSKVVTRYLHDAGVMPYLEALGFHTAAFGCTTCIGNSGPLHPEIETAIVDGDLNVASVLSGNRNFEARIHQNIKSNFLASPMLVVAFALAGRIDVDFTAKPVGMDPNGEPVFLKDIWPDDKAIQTLVQKYVKENLYEQEYSRIFQGDKFWRDLAVTESTTHAWNAASTYIKHPPYFDNFSLTPPILTDIENARPLLLLGDTVTTDHISPAGAIPRDYPAGRYLLEKGVEQTAFNSYGSRRGNHEVMMRGTFGNIRIKNELADGKEGGYTKKMPGGGTMYVYDAAMAYRSENVPLIVIGGVEYGAGSSRDWAAKGSRLLGVKAVIARSFERIHRSNLVGMGVLPLIFKVGESADSLNLDGSETYTISGLKEIVPRQTLTVHAKKPGGKRTSFQVTVRLDSVVETAYFKHGGILPYVLRKILTETTPHQTS